MKLRVGDCVLFNYNTPYNFAISLHNYLHYFESKATHAGIVSKVEKDGVWIHEAVPKPGKDFEASFYEYWWLEMQIGRGIVIVRRPKIKLYSVSKICKSYEDFNYDWASIFLMPFTLVFSTPKIVFCSEAVARIYYDASNKQLNISEELGKHYEKITPMDLYYSKLLDTIYDNT